MKRRSGIIAALAVAVALLALAGCSDGDSDTPAAAAQPDAPAPADTSAAGGPAAPGISAIEEALQHDFEITGPSGHDEDQAPEFTGLTKWLNSPPLTMTELQGEVVLVDFWTYT